MTDDHVWGHESDYDIRPKRRRRDALIDEQILAIAGGIERLSFAVQIIADRCWEPMGMAEADRIRKVGAEVNVAICDAFPTLRGPGEEPAQ